MGSVLSVYARDRIPAMRSRLSRPQVVTENVPGGLSSIGLTVVQNAPADGYTLETMTYDALSVQLLGLAPVDWRARSRWRRPTPRSRNGSRDDAIFRDPLLSAGKCQKCQTKEGREGDGIA